MTFQRFVLNPSADPDFRPPGRVGPTAARFHRSMPLFAPTRLVRLDRLAHELDVGQVVVKDESVRLGLPSFKLLGSSWALRGAVRRRAAIDTSRPLLFSELEELIVNWRPTLCTASDGNHGRAVAALAERVRCSASVFLPMDTTAERARAIESHGAHVERVAGSYDDAVAAARQAATDRGSWYCPDTAGPDATAEERAFVVDVMDGYSTLFEELLDELKGPPDVLFVQAGVGGLGLPAVRAGEPPRSFPR